MWHRHERVSDRYGMVYLMEEGQTSLTKGGAESLIAPIHGLEGRWGKMVAVPYETRISTHIGDFARGISPSRPDVGEHIELGEGYLFYHRHEGVEGVMVGLCPRHPRSSDWLNPQSLYRAHEQSVELFFEETP